MGLGCSATTAAPCIEKGVVDAAVVSVALAIDDLSGLMLLLSVLLLLGLDAVLLDAVLDDVHSSLLVSIGHPSLIQERPLFFERGLSGMSPVLWRRFWLEDVGQRSCPRWGVRRAGFFCKEVVEGAHSRNCDGVKRA